VFFALMMEIVLAVMSNQRMSEPEPVTFAKDVRPILERRCTPCHFSGGVMYARLPFDRAETITKLGTKLFTRIKREDEQKIIRAFLATKQNASPTG